MTAELKGLAVGGDPEVQHSRADEVLIEAIHAMYAMPNYYIGTEVDDLVAAWRSVPKWYA